MGWTLIIVTLISAVAGSILGPVLSARLSKTPQERKDESRNLSAKTESEITKAAKEIADGSTVAVTNLLRSIEYLKLELGEARAENIKLEGEIDTIKTSREESQANLTAALIDSREIRADNAEKEKRITKLEKMIVNQGKYLDTVKTAAQEAGIKVPLNGEVMDSVRKMQFSIEERERLKAGK